MLKTLEHFRNNPQRGATAVEFAVIAALLLVILFGILEYSLIFLQEHYVTNAAREGARVAVRANSFDCDNGNPLPGFTSCSGSLDRVVVAEDAVVEYLSILYGETEVRNGTTITTIDLDEGGAPAESNTTKEDRAIRVTVAVNNPFTNITPQLLKLLRSNSNVSNPDVISFETTMELENQEEVYEN